MYGMQIMSASVAPLADSEGFVSLLTMFNNPVLGILLGTLFTAVIQSSAASIGVLQALSRTGSITFGMALPIIMGQNIGTCITAVLSSLGSSRSGKRVALVHVLFNVLGTIVICLIFYPLYAIFKFQFVENIVDPLGIAVLHSAFNLLTTVILLPFPKQLEKLAYRFIPEKHEKKDDVYIDDRLLLTPAFAIGESRSMTEKMAHIARDTFKSSMKLLNTYDEQMAEDVMAAEALVDKYEDVLGTYLVKLSGRELAKRDSNQISELLHTIGDFERISDHAVNLCRAAKEMHDKGISFSPEAKGELAVMEEAIGEILDISIDAFDSNDPALATKVEPLEQVIDNLKIEIKANHINRLQHGKCTIELGFILSDIISNYERVSDHCSNVAVCIIEIVEDSSFDTHAYLNDIKTGKEKSFVANFNHYKTKYVLPEPSDVEK